MIVDPEYRQGSLCETYGHNWRPTSQTGKFQCSNCRTIAYCPLCLPLLPKSLPTMRCKQHQAKREEAR